MDVSGVSSGSFSKTIADYSKTMRRGRVTWLDAFQVGWSRWKMGIAPGGMDGGDDCDCLHMYLAAADEELLPRGWHRDVYFAFTLCNQAQHPAVVVDMRAAFAEGGALWGCKIVKLSEFHDPSAGYLIEDSIRVKVSVAIRTAFPTIADDTCTGAKKMECCLSDLDKILEVAQSSSTNERAIAENPGAKEIEGAKQSLKECLSDLCNSNIRDKLFAAISTLRLERDGMLSAEQRDCVQHFGDNFNQLVLDYLLFHRENTIYERRIRRKELMSQIVKECYDDHVCLEKTLDSLIHEGEHIKEKIKELNRRSDKEELKAEKDMILEFERVEYEKMKLAMKLEILVEHSKGYRSLYDKSVKELPLAEESKKVAEERLSRSSSAWARLKLHFS